jgi:hypothetical protein
MNGWRDWLKLFGLLAAITGLVGRFLVSIGLVYALATGADLSRLVAIGLIFLLLETGVKIDASKDKGGR